MKKYIASHYVIMSVILALLFCLLLESLLGKEGTYFNCALTVCMLFVTMNVLAVKNRTGVLSPVGMGLKFPGGPGAERKKRAGNFFFAKQSLKYEKPELSREMKKMKLEVRRKNEELAALKEASQIITSTLDVSVIIEYIYNVFNKFSGCDRYLINFMDKNTGKLICKYEFGNVVLNEVGREIPEDSVIMRCLRSKKTIVSVNMFIKSRSIWGDKMAIPLNVSGETVGVLFIESGVPGTFLDVNVDFLENLAVYAAISIKNAEMYNSMYAQKLEIEALYRETAKVNAELNAYNKELNLIKEELKQKNLELMKYNEEINTGYLQTVMALARAVEANDVYTRNHCQRVMEIACVIAENMGYSKSYIEVLRYAAILHDIGKIGIPTGILNKGGALTKQEFEIIKNHPVIAYNILKDVEFLKGGLEAILQHHERYDGNGYPYGLKGAEICEHAKILCVADAFDAMTNDRPYRKGMSVEEALSEIERCSGSQFDPKIAAIFIDVSKQIFGIK